jgi:hypothetical protein
MSHKTMLGKDTTKPLNDASTTFFAGPCAIMSIPSWTIPQIVQDVVLAK